MSIENELVELKEKVDRLTQVIESYFNPCNDLSISQKADIVREAVNSGEKGAVRKACAVINGPGGRG